MTSPTDASRENAPAMLRTLVSRIQKQRLEALALRVSRLSGTDVRPSHLARAAIEIFVDVLESRDDLVATHFSDCSATRPSNHDAAALQAFQASISTATRDVIKHALRAQAESR